MRLRSLERGYIGCGEAGFHCAGCMVRVLKNYPDMAKPAFFWSIDVVCIVAYGDMTTWQREESYAVVCAADKDW